MKKILITGASGFIGSFLTEEALNKGWETWAGIRKSSSWEYLTDKCIHFIDLNYANKSVLKDQITQNGGWDYIIHNAGITKCLDPADFDKVNFQFTKNLIEALEETGFIPDKFILMSSLSAWPNPDTAYGKSKLKAEKCLRSRSSFPYIILRPTGVYGPREKDYYLMVKTIRAGLDVTAGLKTQYLTFIYVKDLVKTAYLCLTCPVQNKEYSVADGNVYTNQEYTEMVKKVLGKKHVLKIKVPFFILKTVSVIAEGISKVTQKPSTLNRDKYKIMKKRDWTCDTTPLEKDLGFQADYNLEKGIRESISWYKENKWT
jgi:nucleoside-diphosphate-sugar epimerase